MLERSHRLYLTLFDLYQETSMTNRIGNKDIAQQRSKSEKARIKASNIANEAVKKAIAKEKYRNAVKGQPASQV
jgi:hypothetical protein